jgi:hypothetical protein
MAMTRYHRGRRHEEKIMNRYKKYPRIHSARSLRVDVVVFSENGVTKLIECKRCSKEAMHVYPEDLTTLSSYHSRLLDLGHNPQMVLSLWFPKKRVTREVVLEPALVAKKIPLRFEFKGNRLFCNPVCSTDA